MNWRAPRSGGYSADQPAGTDKPTGPLPPPPKGRGAAATPSALPAPKVKFEYYPAGAGAPNWSEQVLLIEVANCVDNGRTWMVPGIGHMVHRHGKVWEVVLTDETPPHERPSYDEGVYVTLGLQERPEIEGFRSSVVNPIRFDDNNEKLKVDDTPDARDRVIARMAVRIEELLAENKRWQKAAARATMLGVDDDG